MYFSTSNIIYTYKLSKNQFNTTCCSVSFRIFLETRHLSPHEQCSKGTQTWKWSSPNKKNLLSLLSSLETKPFMFAYTSFSNTKVLSFKCDAYIMYSNEILSWVLFFHWFSPFFFNVFAAHGKHKKNCQTSSWVVALLSPSFLQLYKFANQSMAKTFFCKFAERKNN